MNQSKATTTTASEAAKQQKLWNDFIEPFSKAIGMPLQLVTEKLEPLVGAPGEHAIGALKSEEYAPFAEIQAAFADAKIPLAILRKAVSEHIHESPKDKPDRLGTLTALLTFLKELALNMLMVTYAFGLLSWQAYAWLHGFGYVAALNIQYFTSGLILYIILWLGARILLKALDVIELQSKKAVTRNSRAAEKYNLLIFAAIWACNWSWILFLCFLCGLPLCMCFMGLGYEPLLYLCATIIGVCFLWYKVNIVHQEDDPDSINTWVDRIKRNKGMVLLTVVPVLLMYARWGYPNIPQEFGGGKPKLCYIDMDKEKMSDWIIGELVGDYKQDDILSRRRTAAEVLDYNFKVIDQETNKEAKKVVVAAPTLNSKLKAVHSDILDLWFDSSDYVIVRRHEPENNRGNKASLLNALSKRKVVRIPKNLFMTITIHDMSWADKVKYYQESLTSSSK